MIGVLFAANRSERPFDPDDVSLLVTLATHAAVALDKAHLLSETNEALDELNTASTQRALNAHPTRTTDSRIWFCEAGTSRTWQPRQPKSSEGTCGS